MPKELEIMQEEAAVIFESQYNRHRAKIINRIVCPRNVEEVYWLGINIQYYLSSVYNELSEQSTGLVKKVYKSLALQKLQVKDTIEVLARHNTDKLLQYFYNNGGPIIEPPVSEETADEIKPYLKRFLDSFLNQVNLLAQNAARGEFKAADLDAEINCQIIAMYTAMNKLYQAEDVKNAFIQINDIIKR